MRNSDSMKRIKKKTPGARNTVRFVRKKPLHVLCSECGAKLNRAKLTNRKLSRLSKTKKRPQRPMPNLCSKCMRKYFKTKVM